MSEQARDKLREVLGWADQAFAESGDPMAAIQSIATAAGSGVALPPHMGRWLRDALQTYIRSECSMDTAMGLDKRGKRQPRRRHRASAELEFAFTDMWFLVAVGASHTQAAELVAVRTGRSVEQLVRSYGTSWFGKNPQTLANLDTEVLLRAYPDDARTREAKAAIRQRHAR